MRHIHVASIFLAAVAASYALTMFPAGCQQAAAQPPMGRRGGATVSPEMQARLTELGNRGVGLHDPSTIVKCKDEYWLFYTGRGTPSYRSKDLITWQRGPNTFARPAAWTSQAVPQNRGDFWAPDVIYVGDQYLLFYSVSSFGVNTSAIGVATNPTLDSDDPEYKWTDGGMVVQSDSNSDFNTIDPAVIVDTEGKLWMAFGSFWSGIRMIELDPKTGLRIAPDSPMYHLAHYDSIEAAHLYHHGDYYYLFLDWGMCCRGVNSTYNIRVGRSSEITGPYLDKEGKDMKTGGGTLLAETDGPMIGPGHPGIIEVDGKYWMSMHFYNGAQNGASTLAIRPLTWNDDGWPELGEQPAEPEE